MEFVEERQRFAQLLSAVSYLRVIPSQANYFLCEVLAPFTSASLTQSLIERDVLISNCGNKSRMEGHQIVRIAVRDRKDNDRLIEILNSLVTV